MKGASLKVGDTVRLVHGTQTAKVVANTIGGRVRLSERLGGFYNWSEKDLIKVEDPNGDQP